MIPLFPLNAVLLPGGELTLKVVDPRYQALLKDCLEVGESFGVVYCADYNNERDTLKEVGCVAHVTKHELLTDGAHHITIKGGDRFYLRGLTQTSDGVYCATTQRLDDERDITGSDPLIKSATYYSDLYHDLLQEMDPEVEHGHAPFPLRAADSFAIIDQIVMPEGERQEALEVTSMRQRFEMGIELLKREVETLRFLMIQPEDSDLYAVN